jgi:SNF2 family DNA or RNA helicase
MSNVAVRQRSDLEFYQDGPRSIARFVERVPKCAVWAEMGSGKSIATLTGVIDLINRFEVHRVLVVAPLRVAKKTWADEIEDWAHARHLRFIFLDGPLLKIAKILQTRLNDFDVWAISCDKVRVLETLFQARQHIWDTMIIDESPRFKNPSAKRSLSMRLLTMRCKRVIELTGTPMPNGIKDLWHQIYLLDRGERLGPNIAAFERRFFEHVTVTHGDGTQELVKKPTPGAEKVIMKLLSDIVYVLRPEDYNSIKKPLYNAIKIPLPENLHKAYKSFERDYVLSLPDGDKITAMNASGLGVKLLQFASGAIYDKNREAKIVHRLKIEALEELIEDNPDKPILLAYNFKHEIPRIFESFPHAEVLGKDGEQIDRWNAGKIRMLIAHPKSAAHGLNLQFGGHILIWFSLPGYNLEDYLQMNKRLPRKGQQHRVAIHHLIVEKTADEAAMRAINRKDHEQEEFQNEMKLRIKAILQEAA